MQRTDRLFEIIQLLRSEKSSITANQIAQRLEVSTRTIFRDIQTLQSMRTPIEGEDGVDYLLRPGYDLPPLNFTVDEIEAIVVGLSLVARTGDKQLKKSADRVLEKIDKVREKLDSLQVPDWGATAPQSVDPALLRIAIRDEQKLSIHYQDENHNETTRILLPIGIIYYVESIVLIAWCELRLSFRHFRVDRIQHCELTEAYFKHQGNRLRTE
jgi:predicted DNA-binding transcriptional regulator YafY